MKKILLHIGTPKTGTSALQNFFMNNIELLREEGIYYPEHKLDSNGVSSGNGTLLFNAAKNSFIKDGKQIIKDIMDETSLDSILLSSEGFYRYPEELYSIIGDATIIVYFREQSTRMLSSYNQSVKRKNNIITFDTFVDNIFKKNDGNFDGAILKKWAELFGIENIIFRPYEKEQFIGGNIYTDFLNILGSKTYENYDFPTNEINISYNKDALVFKLLVNRIVQVPQKGLDRTIDLALQKYSLEHNEDDKKIRIDVEISNKIQSHYKERNKELASLFLNRDTLFYTENTYDNNFNYTLNLNTMKSITKYILEENPKVKVYLIKNIMQGILSETKQQKNSAILLLPILGIPMMYNKVKKMYLS